MHSVFKPQQKSQRRVTPITLMKISCPNRTFEQYKMTCVNHNPLEIVGRYLTLFFHIGCSGLGIMASAAQQHLEGLPTSRTPKTDPYVQLSCLSIAAVCWVTLKN